MQNDISVQTDPYPCESPRDPKAVSFASNQSELMAMEKLQLGTERKLSDVIKSKAKIDTELSAVLKENKELEQLSIQSAEKVKSYLETISKQDTRLKESENLRKDMEKGMASRSFTFRSGILHSNLSIKKLKLQLDSSKSDIEESLAEFMKVIANGPTLRLST